MFRNHRRYQFIEHEEVEARLWDPNLGSTSGESIDASIPLGRPILKKEYNLSYKKEPMKIEVKFACFFLFVCEVYQTLIRLTFLPLRPRQSRREADVKTRHLFREHRKFKKFHSAYPAFPVHPALKFKPKNSLFKTPDCSVCSPWFKGDHITSCAMFVIP